VPIPRLVFRHELTSRPFAGRAFRLPSIIPPLQNLTACGIGSLLHLESHPGGPPSQTLTGPPETSTAQERSSTSGDGEGNLGMRVYNQPGTHHDAACPESAPPISLCLRSAYPLRAPFQAYKALCRLTIDISTLFATYRYIPPTRPQNYPGSSVPSLNHRRGCAQLLTILLQFYHCERSIKQKIAPAHHLRYFDIGSDLFGTRTSTRLACFCAHVLPVYIRIPSFPPAPFALRLGLEHTRYLSQNRIAP
jgi:hypothetical protein